MARWLMLGVALLCGACQPIVGIRERSSAITEACVDYCAHVDAQCTDFPAYKSTDHCEAWCANLDPPGSREGSLTLECLEEHTGRLSEWPACEAASPSGGDKCGDRCEVYCKIYPRICGSSPAGANAEECAAFCGELKDGKDVNGLAAFDGGDTLQCRLAHLSAAAVEAISGTDTARRTHCGHARGDLSGNYCVDAKPDCEQYCSVVMAACIGADNTQYRSSEDCKAVCENLPHPAMLPKERSETPTGCRLQNAYTALQTGASDACKWAGPAGSGEDGCGSVCGSYCELLAKACPSAGFERFGQDAAAAITACTDQCVKGDHPGHPRQFKCRLENIASALRDKANEPTLCGYAFGGGPCGPGNMGQ